MQERDAISGKGSQKITQHDHEEADCKVTDEQRLAPHGQAGVEIRRIRTEEP